MVQGVREVFQVLAPLWSLGVRISGFGLGTRCLPKYSYAVLFWACSGILVRDDKIVPIHGDTTTYADTNTEISRRLLLLLLRQIVNISWAGVPKMIPACSTSQLESLFDP